MVGSDDSIASPNTVLNAIVAEAFCEAADILEAADDFDMALHDLIKKNLADHQRIIFNGNGYSEEWVAEAERRGLPNIKSMVETVPSLTTEKAVKLFEKFGIFTKEELESRAEVLYDTYAKVINIEALTMIDMASKQLIPAIIAYTTSLAESITLVKDACALADTSAQEELLIEVSSYLAQAQKSLRALIKAQAESAAIISPEAKAQSYYKSVMPAMEALRAPIDKAEMIVVPGGGGGVECIEGSKEAMAIIKEAYDRGIEVSAICAGPRALSKLGIMEGRKGVCYPGMEDQIIGGIMSQETSTVRDGKVTTGRGPGAAFDFGLALLEVLRGKEAADEVAGQLFYERR